jgi:hypothetical protein
MVLTNFPYDPILDLAPWVGQRQCTYRFQRVNAVTGQDMGEVHPVRSGPALSHDTTRLIKRQLNLSLGVEDTASINVLQDRILPFMVFPNGTEYPLGRYVFTQQSDQVFTSGQLSNVVLNDEGYIVDQQITTGLDASSLAFAATPGASPPSTSFAGGQVNRGSVISRVLEVLLTELDIQAEVESSPFVINQAWGAGASRGSIIETMALAGDYLSPWFDNNGIMQFIRSFNPALRIPDFDWDAGNQVMRSSIVRQSDILNAPNRFVVISNSSSTPGQATFGQADVPPNAPHSFENRGFRVPSVIDTQLLTTQQCQAVAQNLVERQMIFETTTLTTAPDPRHDGYNVIHWQGELWLEIGWNMTLVEGQPMTHTLRRSYR